MLRKALFLDRDGVINVDRHYIHRQDQFEFIAGIFELVRFVAGEWRWPVVIVTNQAGIGRGYFSEADYQALTRWMCGRFAAENAPITQIYHCPYHPEFGIGAYRLDHPWRKPKPGMLLQAAADLGLDLGRSVMIGDGLIDMQAAAAAGVGLRIWLRPTNAGSEQKEPAHEPVSCLAEALMLMRTRCSPGN